MTTKLFTRSGLLALALGLAIAIGGLVTLDRGSAQAANADRLDATPVADAEACSTHGYYYPTFSGDITVVTGVTTTYPAGYYPFYGYPYYGYPFAGYPVVTVQTETYTVPELPYYGEPYTSPTQVNYACNAFDNCVPVSTNDAVVCPGNPAGITVSAASTATCGSALNIDAKVAGPSGLIVANGTPVQFSSSLGLIPADTTTDDGIASVQLVIPTRTSGTATVAITAGTAKATHTVSVTC